MSTSINLKDVRSSKTQYANLNDELQGIHEKQIQLAQADSTRDSDISELSTRADSFEQNIQQVETDIDGIKTELAGIDHNLSTVQEVVEARDGHDSLNDRLNSIEQLSVFQENLKLTTDRKYTYNAAGFVEKEVITGDINYEIVYNYDGDNNITSEDHYHNGELVGTKSYIYDPVMGYIKQVISDKADDVQLVYNDDTTQDLNQRLLAIETMNLRAELDEIKASILIGPYDGKRLKDLVDSFEARLESVEQFANGQIEQIVDVPDLTRRIENLEYALSNGRQTDEFIVDNNKSFKLSAVVTLDSMRIYVDGIYVEGGSDYVLGEDRQTITFSTKLLNGSRILCEYY